MPTIAIIILNWNQPSLTIATIDSFLKIYHNKFTFQIILVDNGSNRQNIKLINDHYKKDKQIVFVYSKTNTGYAAGNNLGINYALKHNFDYILIANNDIRVDPDFLAKLYTKIKNKPKSIFAPKIYFEKGFEYHKDWYKKTDLGKVIWAMGGKLDWDNVYGSNIAIDEVDTGQYDFSHPSPDFISGCCFLAKSMAFKDIGLFDEKYYLYMEDDDWSVRATKLGYSLEIVPQSTIWHINSGSAGAASNFQDYFITRNRILFAYKYAPFRTKFAIFRESIKLFLIGRLWQKIGVKDYYLSKFGKGSWV